LNTTLSISIVTYCPDLDLLKGTIKSLYAAVKYAIRRGSIGSAHLAVIENGYDSQCLNEVTRIAKKHWCSDDTSLFVHSGHGNVGYGRGHNYGIQSSGSVYHLVLNPDVLISEPALENAVRFLQEHQSVGLLTPRIEAFSGDCLYLNKRYPALLTLVMRGIASLLGSDRIVRSIFGRQMDYYTMNDVNWENPFFSRNLLVSGCFMLFRKECLDRVKGFSSDFFLYFEDYDLSIRIAEFNDIAYDPTVEIIHFGGHSAKKGWNHIKIFVRSAVTFYRKHGWQLI